jgi:ribosomal protein S12 methylthiotransferase accessory factor
MYHPKEFPLYSFEAAPFPCVPPEEFALYGKQQYKQDDFPFVPFEKKTPTRWTAVLDPVTGETVYVPVAMVFLFTHGLKMNGEKPIAQSVSTGLACHLDPVRAAISAICEVIERDAFTITWQAMLPRPRIHTETLSEHNRNLLYRFERTGCQVALFYLRMDHRIPTVLAVSQSRGRETPALAFAAAANLDPEQAVRRSLEELAHTLPLAQWIKKSAHRLRPSPRYQNVVSLHDHANLYCDARNARLTDFLFSTQQRIGFDEIENISTANLKKDLKTLCDEVRRVNHRVLLADVTSDDVRQVGLAVIRAVIPGFHPLFFGHSLRALGGSRLWNVPLNLGFRGITPESGDNPAPHPFP